MPLLSSFLINYPRRLKTYLQHYNYLKFNTEATIPQPISFQCFIIDLSQRTLIFFKKSVFLLQSRREGVLQRRYHIKVFLFTFFVFWPSFLDQRMVPSLRFLSATTSIFCRHVQSGFAHVFRAKSRQNHKALTKKFKTLISQLLFKLFVVKRKDKFINSKKVICRDPVIPKTQTSSLN